MSKKQFSCQDGASRQFELLRWLLWLCSCTQCSWLLFKSVLIQQWWLWREGSWWSNDKSFFNVTVLIPGKHHCPLCHRPPEPGEHLFHECNPSVAQVPSTALPPLSGGLCAVALGRWIWQVPTGQKCAWICRSGCVWVDEVVFHGVRHILRCSIPEETCHVLGRTGDCPFTAEAGEMPQLPQQMQSGLLGNGSSVWQGMS